ncbi:MAG TPA: hypothetical protein VJP85_12875 [Candidatus Baltobacteraceae bacterium]|nr:hypothetical protein [Candidatus Baltobacteraceae bacterium]
MPRLADRDPRLVAVDSTLRELETLCGRMERALTTRNWPEIDAAVSDARRVTHALQNAMDDAAPARTKAFDEHVFARLRYVGAIRENQLKRLQQYRDAVGERLQLLGRWKSALRSFSGRTPTGPSLNDVR